MTIGDLEELLENSYKSFLENVYYVCPENRGASELCVYCEKEKGYNHDEDCIVLKAEEYLNNIIKEGK